MNKKIIKASLGILGIALGVAMLLGTWRNLVWAALASGIWGASLLAIVVGVLGTLIGVLIIYNSYNFLTKKKEPKNETN